MAVTDSEEAQHACLYALSYEFHRAAVRVLLRASSTAAVAKMLGTTRAALRDFMDGGAPDPTLWEAIRDAGDGMEPQKVEIEAIALNLIADTFPLPDRARMRRALANAIRPVLRAEGRGPSTV